ncbi:hypothetical protein OH77DRAFT_1459300 [Trametes cingulata]|nr:hypothetical protein OH77DRAFT_1459300 [Trametes cingulata]
MDTSPIRKYLVKMTPEERQERDAREREEIRARARAAQVQKISHTERKRERVREQNRIRKQRERERRYEHQKDLGLRDEQGCLINAKRKRPTLVRDSAVSANSNSASRYRVQRSAEKDQKERKRAKRTNWFLPSTWTMIDAAAKACMFRPGEMVKHLQSQLAGKTVFKSLRAGTISHWIDTRGPQRKWKDDVLEKVKVAGARERKGPPLGRRNIMSHHPAVRKRIVTDLVANRRMGIAITVSVARAIILSHIEAEIPELLTEEKFKCSDRFVRQFLDSELEWSYRTATRAAQKTPENWESLCEDMFLRIVHVVLMRKTPPEAILNGDQTGVALLPSGNKTWDEIGSKQVDMFGKEEKRQFTLMITTSCSGKILPVQTIWSGKTPASLPASKLRAPLEKDGHIWSLGGEKHWSNFPCMVEWVKKIVVPYLEQLRVEKGLERLHSLLVIDCWSVHRGEEFRVWMKTSFGWIRLVFVPGGCTGKFQPNDVGIQRIFKFIIKSEATQYLIQETKKQLSSNPREPALLPTSIGPLRNASVAWVQKAYEYFAERPELVKKAWEKCRTGPYNLSYECITSERARCVLSERLDEDAGFALSADPIQSELELDDHVDGEEYDDDLGATAEAVSQQQLLSDLPPGSQALQSSPESLEDTSNGSLTVGLDMDGNVELVGGPDYWHAAVHEPVDSDDREPESEADGSGCDSAAVPLLEDREFGDVTDVDDHSSLAMADSRSDGVDVPPDSEDTGDAYSDFGEVMELVPAAADSEDSIASSPVLSACGDDSDSLMELSGSLDSTLFAYEGKSITLTPEKEPEDLLAQPGVPEIDRAPGILERYLRQYLCWALSRGGSLDVQELLWHLNITVAKEDMSPATQASSSAVSYHGVEQQELGRPGLGFTREDVGDILAKLCSEGLIDVIAL